MRCQEVSGVLQINKRQGIFKLPWVRKSNKAALVFKGFIKD
jgi:hypothetical protein